MVPGASAGSRMLMLLETACLTWENGAVTG